MSIRVQRIGNRVAVVLPDEPLTIEQARQLALDLRAAADGHGPDRSVVAFCAIHRGQMAADWSAASDLRAAYRRWCTRTDRQPISERRFYAGLRALLPYRRDIDRRRYRL